MPFQSRIPPRTHRSRFWPFIAKLSVELLEDRTLLDAAALSAVVDFSALQLDPDSYDPHSLLVRFRPETVWAAETETFSGVYLDDSFSLVPGLWEVRLEEGVDVHAALEAFQSDPNVLYAELNYRVYVSLIPNDPRFGELYGLHNTGQAGGTPDADIDAPEAWDVSTGNRLTIVAVIDTGVDYTHPDLAANIWTNSGEANGTPGVDDDGNGYIDDIHGYDFVNNDGNPMDDNGHGTHVSGTIGAVGNNAIGVTGVTWNTQIMGVKFLGAGGSGSLQGAINALEYAVLNGATISNNSWGGGPFTQALYDAINAAGQVGHLFVAAAGNSGLDTDLRPAYPASYDLDNIISVAATDRNDNMAGFSNYGKITVDLGAPGVDILSTLPGGGYGALSGTSMATPHVTGVAALLRDLHPEWSFQQVKDVILSTTDPINSLLGRTVSNGRLNAAAAVSGMPPADQSGPRVIAASPSGGVNGPVGSVRLTFDESVEVGSFDASDIVSFVGPNGAIAVTSVQVVAGPDNRQFDVQFAAQSVLGTYTMVIGPNILDLAGNPMNQDNDAINGEVPQDRYQTSFNISEVMIFCATDVPQPIFDFGAIYSYIWVGEHFAVSDLDVQLNITHTFTSDLVIYLWSASGTVVNLSTNRGGSGDDFQDTVFDDEAATPIGSGSAPFSGSYQPETPLSALDGEDAWGFWTLVIEDFVALDEGSLNAWCLMLQAGTPPPGGGNNPPTPVDDVAQTLEDTPVVIDVLANDTDPDGDPLTIVAVSDGGFGRVVLNLDDTVTYTPDPDLYGTDYFVYTVTDGQGNEVSAEVQVTVESVNDAPVAVDDTAMGRANTPLVLSSLEANDFDADGDWLYVSQVGNAVHGTVVLNSDGTVTFTPEPGYVGVAGFEYTVTDGTLDDIGYVEITFENTIYFSTTTDATLTNSDGSTLAVGDEDIVRLVHDAAGYRFTLYFDGGDVGLALGNEDIDAFYLRPDGQIVFSTLGAFSVPGAGGASISGGGEDLLMFRPTSLGSNTAGTWSFLFDGSDVGLNTAGERIDAVAMQFDGSFLLSMSGAVNVALASGQDEDLFLFRPTRVGSDTAGSWSLYFDGSDVGLSDGDAEDVDGLFMDTDGSTNLPPLYFTTRGDFAVAGLNGANEDIFGFHPDSLGGNTSGVFESALMFDGSLYGLTDLDLDGIFLGRAPFDPTSLALSAGPGEGFGPGGPALPRTAGGLNGPSVVEIFRELLPGGKPLLDGSMSQGMPAPPPSSPGLVPADVGPDSRRAGPAVASPSLSIGLIESKATPLFALKGWEDWLPATDALFAGLI